MKYFFASDLHGIHPKVLDKALKDAGFTPSNKEHKIVIAGDICDGLGNDSLLINYLMNWDKKGKLIAVKGNHDFGTDGVYFQHLNYEKFISEYAEQQPLNNTNFNYLRGLWTRLYNYTLTEIDILKIKALSKVQVNWIKKLPYQLETDHFYLAHGMYVPDQDQLLLNKEQLSIWGCPMLLDLPMDNWWTVKDKNPTDVIQMKDRYKNLDVYADKFKKDLYLGHFGQYKLEEISKRKTEGELFTHKNITWLDSSVLRNYMKTGKHNLKVFVKEY